MRQATLALFMVLVLANGGVRAADTAPEKKVLTLSQAQAAAMENSLTIKDASYDLEAAKRRIWENTSTGLPQIDAKYSFTFNPGSIAKLPFGPNGEMVPIQQRSTSNLTATVSQLIFSGSYIVGLKAAKTYQEMVQQSLEKSKIDVRTAVAQSYYLILLTSETHEVLKGNLENFNKLLADSQKLLEKGFAEETSVDQLSLTVSDLEIAIKSIQNQEQVARRLMNFQIGLALDTQIELADKLEDVVRGINREKVLGTPFVIDRNIEYQMAQTNIKLSSQQYSLEKVSYLPSIRGFYQYYKDFKAPFLAFNPEQMLGVNIDIPIFSSGQRLSKVKQAKLMLSKAENAKELAERSLNMEYLQASEEFNTAWDKYLNSKKSQKIAQKVMNDVMIKFNNGMASSMDLTQANDKFLQTVSTLYSSEFDLLKAKIRLDKVTSNL